MKQLTPFFSLVCVAMLSVGCAQQSGDQAHDEMAEHDAVTEHDMAPDAPTANPDVYTVLHDDERVRILNMMLPAGIADGLHAHPDEAAYFISGSKVRVTSPEGESTEMDIPDGAPFSHEAWTHTVENIGDKDLHAVVVEFKEGARDSAGAVPEGMGAAETSTDFYTVLSEDDRVRILEMRLPAGQTDNEHVHPAEAAYFLTGGKANIHLPSGEVMDVELPDGAVLSNPAWRHQVENTGETEIHAIVFELKQPAPEM